MLDDFVQAYAETALWSSLLDGDYTIDDIDAETWERMKDDCREFCGENIGLLMAYAVAGRSVSDAAHDFWLTRNGLGAGFWDRGLPQDLSDALTEAAKAFGSFDLYDGIDGMT